MRVAIFGAGFAGLATTWFLLYHSRGSVTVDLYDPTPIGGGVSGISSGLLHPYAGKHAKIAKDSEKKLNAVHRLIKEAAQALGKPFLLSKGILRPAITLQQIEDFKNCSLSHTNDTEWWEPKKCQDHVKGLVIPENGGGLYIKHGLTLDVQEYLRGLWHACALMGSQYHQTGTISEKELKQYDHVIFAVGHATKMIPFLSHLPIELIKGQVLTIAWPKELPPLPCSVISEGYLVMGKEGKTALAGATFERNFANDLPEPEVARIEIQRKIAPFFPAIMDAEILSCKAGIRAASMRNHLPMMGKVSDKVWFVTGLGSKGLLYHGWLGDYLSRALLKNDLHYIPEEVRFTGTK